MSQPVGVSVAPPQTTVHPSQHSSCCGVESTDFQPLWAWSSPQPGLAAVLQAAPALGISLLSPQAPASSAAAQRPQAAPAQGRTPAQAGAAGQDQTGLQQHTSTAALDAAALQNLHTLTYAQIAACGWLAVLVGCTSTQHEQAMVGRAAVPTSSAAGRWQQEVCPSENYHNLALPHWLIR